MCGVSKASGEKDGTIAQELSVMVIQVAFGPSAESHGALGYRRATANPCREHGHLKYGNINLVVNLNGHLFTAALDGLRAYGFLHEVLEK